MTPELQDLTHRARLLAPHSEDGQLLTELADALEREANR